MWHARRRLFAESILIKSNFPWVPATSTGFSGVRESVAETKRDMMRREEQTIDRTAFGFTCEPHISKAQFVLSQARELASPLKEWLRASGRSFIEVRSLASSFFLARSRGPRAAQTHPVGSALVSREGDKTVIRCSRSFNVVSVYWNLSRLTSLKRASGRKGGFGGDRI